jgi:glycerol kinase
VAHKYILAIDQGTTGSRALLYSQHGRVKSQAYQEIKQYYPRPGWVEHDASEILRSIQNVVGRAIQSAHISPSAIGSIGITNQRETVVFWDKRTGRPSGKAIVWQDRRTEGLCRTLRDKGLEPEVHRKTGLFFDPYFSGTKIRWLLNSQPRLRKQAELGNLCFGTIDSWLLYCLTGKRIHATDYTNASRTLLFNIKSKRWDKRLMRMFHVPMSILPTALPSNSVFGTTKNFRPLPDGIPINAILGDQQAALYGQSCYNKGTSKNTYGTGCFLLVNLGQKIIHSKAGLVTTIACDRKGNPAYAIEASIFIAGAAVQWLRDGIRLIKTASETERIARNVRNLNEVVLIPAFTGLGAPHWRPDVRGAIFGITRGTTREMVIKAAVDSIGFQVEQVFNLIKSESRVNIRALKVDGGATNNLYLMQFQADLLNVPVLRSSVQEATAWGVAKLAGIASGIIEDLNAVDRTVRYKTFSPKMSSSVRSVALSRWRCAVSQLTARRS